MPILKGDCQLCRVCIENCPNNVITTKDDKLDFNNYQGCYGCGICLDVCPNNCLKPKVAEFGLLLAEGAQASIKNKKTFYINTLINMTEKCDCFNNPGSIVLEDMGFLLDKDIVAIDKASLDLIKKKDPAEITLIFGVRTKTDLLYHNEWIQLVSKINYIPLLSRETWDGEQGHVQDILNKIDLQDADFYICGLPKMVTETKNLLLEKYVPKEKIHHEIFV